MKKIVSILVMIMLACTGLILVVDNDFNVEGSSGGDNGWVNETLLDYTYMFDILDNLTYVVHNDSIWGSGDEVIRMGRDFGTPGDNWTANYIFKELNFTLGLENVTKIKLETIGPENYEGEIPWKNEEVPWRCDYKIETVDYNLTFNHPEWPEEWSSDGHVPKNESSVMPSAWVCLNFSNPDYNKLSYNNSFMNSEIEHKNIGEKILMEGATSENYFNVSIDNVTNIDILCGNVTYLTIGENLPVDQDYRLFLFDEEQNCEDQLANVTNATGVILIHNNAKGYTANTSSYQNISIGRCNISDNNITDVIDMLENGTAIFAENTIDSEILTFYHNFSYLTWWPKDQNNGLFIIHEFSDWGPIWKAHAALGAGNYFFQEHTENGFLHGFIIYDNYADVHIMEGTSKDWRGWNYPQNIGYVYNKTHNMPPLQTFLINKTIWEDFLMEHIEDEDNTVSGYFEQRENENVEAYNVLGNITIDQSPDDAIIIVEGRPDAHWGECPGDSGAGVGIIMGIAKYIKDNGIKPKYNLTFLFTTGEEYGMKGSWYHSLSHPDDNIIYWIGTDQLGFNFEGTGQVTILSNNSTIGDRGIVWAIANDTQLVEDSGYGFDTKEADDPQSTNEAAFRWRGEIFGKNCSTICIHKAGLTGHWDFHHRAGKNYTEGDSMKYMDRDDLNATLNFSWGIVKYYCFNPDCWLTNYTASIYDSPEDVGNQPDSIRANFTMKTVLPHDLVMVHAYLRNSTGDANQTIVNYTINSTGKLASISLTLPPGGIPGFYKLYLELYNSSGKINEIAFGESVSNVNDTEPVPPQTGYIYPYVPDTVPPSITNVSVNPDMVGFGFNVTISVNVTDDGSGLSSVKVNITQPDNNYGNYSMNYVSGNTYQYIFSDTWLHGQYNYTIWATDNASNNNTTSVYSFNVSANATINVCTLKNNYTEGEFVNITDPPNPLDDYYIVDRGLTWDKYYNTSTGANTLIVSQCPINYKNETNEWIPINCSLNMLENNHIAYGYGYRMGNEHGLYNIYFKPNTQDNWPVVFAYNKSTDPENFVVRSKLIGVGYLDPTNNWDHEILQNTQSSLGQITGNSITYENVFTGTDVVWSYGNTGLKEEIIMSNTTKSLLQNHPPSDYGLNNHSSYLVFITRLDYSGLNMYNSTGTLNGNFTIIDGQIDFKDVLGQFKCALPLGEAYELYNNSVSKTLVCRVLQYNNNYYLLSGLKLVDLNNMSFPVVIDPTLTLTSLSSDGYIYASSTNYNTAWTASSGTVSSNASYISIGQKKASGIPQSSYYIYRGFLMFNTSEIPFGVNITNATLSLYKKDDCSTTDFILTLQNGQPVYPHIPLQPSDYNKSYYSGNIGELNTSNFVNGTNNITLTDFRWIQKGGITKFCLRSSRDISGTAPTGNEYVNVYSADAPLIDYFPKLIITYYNQSKIKNTGSTNISGYLLMQVHFYNKMQIPPGWIVANNTINETTPRIINVGQQFGLDTVFNNHVNTSDLLDLYGRGLYRVYASFRDPEGNVLVCDDDSLLEVTYEFNII